MSQDKQRVNSHIETYLDYYCGLSHAPGFAVLLQGQWGCGKTWLINKYREKLKGESHKCLYTSLYGMTSFSEIEDAFFQQLHPILSSKGMAITSKIVKGLLKGTLKIDLNDDTRDDGTLNIQVPEINIPEYLKDTDKSVLIFDDLERCKMELNSILGYINYFVEHQELKVILVANEDELLKNCSYREIKEKLIGKTFSVSLDFDGALENFITIASNSDVREFLCCNTELIQDLYKKAEYENLRNLKQVVLDFERIFNALPENAKSKSEVLQELLKLLTAFSIEIKRGVMLPRDIGQLQEEYISSLRKSIVLHRSPSITEDDNKELSPLRKMLDRYTSLNLYDPFPSKVWWQMFFEKGIVDTEELEQSINRKYFQHENTPNWVRLWHFYDLSDDEFNSIINGVELEYNNRFYSEIGVIKHVFGLFLELSDAGLYHKSKEEILEDSKSYIDHLKDCNQDSLINYPIIEDIFGSYGGFGFYGTKFEEFKKLSSYINEVRELATRESMYAAGQDLLSTMQSDCQKFYRMTCLSSSDPDKTILTREYREIPIFIYIEPAIFIEKLLLLNSKDQRYVFSALGERYKFDNINESLIEELEWLKTIRNLLHVEVSHRQGKISGFILDSFTRTLNEVIEKLEIKKAQIQTSL